LLWVGLGAKNWAGLGFEKAFHVNSGLSAQAVELLRSELALGQPSQRADFDLLHAVVSTPSMLTGMHGRDIQ